MTIQFAPRWTDATTNQTCIVGNAADIASAAASTLLDLQVNNVSKFVVDKFGELIITPTARTAGSDALINLVAPADTTRAASTEAVDINFNLARTVQFAAGNITDQRAIRIQAPTYSFASASTITNASTLSIGGAPTAGTNATLSNRWALNVESGDIRLSSNAAVVWPNGISIRDNSPSGFGLTITPPNFVPLITLFANATIRGFYTNHTLEIGHSTAQVYYSASNHTPDIDTNRIVVRASDGLHVRHSSPTSSGKLLTYNTFTDNSNYERLALQFGTFSSARYAQIAAESAGTGTANINLVLTPRGNGALIFGPPPDGTTTGGNARGVNAVDLQTSRTLASQVASGANAFIFGDRNTASNSNCFAGGANNKASGTNAFSHGVNCESSGNASFSTGQSSISTGQVAFSCGSTTASGNTAFSAGTGAVAFRPSQFSHSSGRFSVYGDGQYTRLVGGTKTFGLTPAFITLSGVNSADGSGNWLSANAKQISIPTGTLLSFLAMITGAKSDGSSVAFYVRKGTIKNVGGTVTLVSLETIGTDIEDAANTNVNITADNVNKFLSIELTGIENETWRWLAAVEAVEITFGV